MCGNRRCEPNIPSFPSVITINHPSPLIREMRLILNLQRQAEQRGNSFSCNPDELGGPVSRFNTRPFILYLPNGEEFSIRIGDLIVNNPINTPASLGTNSIINSIFNNPARTCTQQRAFIFRIEDLNGNLATLRALKYVLGKYIATCHCAIVDLDEFAGFQPLNDTFVNLVC